MNQNNYYQYGPLSTYVAADTASVTVNSGTLNQYTAGYIMVNSGINILTATIEFTGTYLGGGQDYQIFYFNNATQNYCMFPFSGTYSGISITMTSTNSNLIPTGSFLQTFFSYSGNQSTDLKGLSNNNLSDITNTNDLAYSSTGSQAKNTNILAKKRTQIMSINQPMSTDSSSSNAFFSTTASGNVYSISAGGSMLLWPALRQGISNNDTIIMSGSVACASPHSFSVECGNSVFKYNTAIGYSFGRTRTKGEIRMALTNSFPTTVAGNYSFLVFGTPSVNVTIGSSMNSSSGPVVAAGICAAIAPLYRDYGILVTYADSSLYFREINSEIIYAPLSASSLVTSSSVTVTFTTLVVPTTSATVYSDFLGSLYGGPGVSVTSVQDYAMILTKGSASLYVSVPNKDNMICAGTIGSLNNDIIDSVPTFYSKNDGGSLITLTATSVEISLVAPKRPLGFTISHLGGIQSASQLLRKYALNCITSVARTNKGTVFELTQVISGGTIGPASYSMNAIRTVNPLTSNMSITSSDSYAFWAEGYSVTIGTSDTYSPIEFGTTIMFRPPVYENVGIIASPMIAGLPRPLLVFTVLN